jgi:hypothetical protein
VLGGELFIPTILKQPCWYAVNFNVGPMLLYSYVIHINITPQVIRYWPLLASSKFLAQNPVPFEGDILIFYVIHV